MEALILSFHEMSRVSGLEENICKPRRVGEQGEGRGPEDAAGGQLCGCVQCEPPTRTLSAVQSLYLAHASAAGETALGSSNHGRPGKRPARFPVVVFAS